MSTTTEVYEAALLLRHPDGHERILDQLRKAQHDLDMAQRITQQRMDAGMSVSSDMVDRATARVTALQPLADLQHQQQNRQMRLDDIDGPTAETTVHARSSHDPIKALYDGEKIDQAQVMAAMQIERIYTIITAAMWSKTASLEGRVQGNGRGGIPERIAELHRDRYLPWARWMSDSRSMHLECACCGPADAAGACTGCGRRLWSSKPCLPLLIDVAVFGRPIKAAAKQNGGMRYPRAVRLIRLGLERYVEMGGGKR